MNAHKKSTSSAFYSYSTSGVLMIFISLFMTNVYAQTIKFCYDAAGNRTKRTSEPLCLKPPADTIKKAGSELIAAGNSLVTYKSVPVPEVTSPVENTIASDVTTGEQDKFQETENVKKDKNAFEVNIFPNPAEQFLNINILGPLPKAQLNYIFYNSKGEIYYQSGLTKNINRINVNNFPKGIYYLIIESDGFRQKQKVIIE